MAPRSAYGDVIVQAMQQATQANGAQIANIVAHQAQTIAFLNDFKLLVATTIAGIPLALLFRKARQATK